MRSVNLAELATGFGGAAKVGSHYKRLQRFFRSFEIGYDDQTGEMLVTWQNGKTSAYGGVSEQLADEISRAPSVGEAINSQIKGVYGHRYR